MGIQQELKQNRPFVSVTQEAAIALVRTADLMRRSFSVVIDPYGITTQQYNVLRILRGAGSDGLPTLEIAERMIEQAPGITRLIDRLEAKGLVSRQRCATDRRQVFCRITPEGLALLGRLADPVRQAEEASLTGLSEKEITQLLKLLERTRTGLHAVLAAHRVEETMEA